MKKVFFVLIFSLALVGPILGILYYRNNPSEKEIDSPEQVEKQPGKATDTTGKNLSLPENFAISIYAKNLGKPRDLLWVNDRLIVSIPERGQVVELIDSHGNGWSDDVVVVAGNLNRPHGLAYKDGNLFIAETDKVSVFDYQPGEAAKKVKTLFDLPSGGSHWTRSLLLSENKLYISIGSSCNVCNESDLRRAAVLVSNLDGTGVRNFATGLRNAVFMTQKPGTRDIFVTENGRDRLGDDLPPDEINIIEDGKDYGWPYCYGKNIFDKTFEQAKYKAEPGQQICEQLNKTESVVDIQAHSAPLGLAFTPNTWPQSYQNKLLVALHGSWNRSVPTGYKIISIDFDLLGNPADQSDFISGWLKSDNKTVTGRPVDLEFDPEGNLFISDDGSGVVYKLTPPKK